MKRQTILKLSVILFLALIIIVNLISACGGSEPTPHNAQHVEGQSNIQRFYDPDADVICWWFTNYGYSSQSGGIACLPRDDTSLTLEQVLVLR